MENLMLAVETAAREALVHLYDLLLEMVKTLLLVVCPLLRTDKRGAALLTHPEGWNTSSIPELL